MSTPILAVYNNHSPSCGVPPIARNSEETYIGYFENTHGEQWIFTCNRKTKAAFLYGGDIDWSGRQVVDGSVPGLPLSDEEANWLRTCWIAIAGKQST